LLVSCCSGNANASRQRPGSFYGKIKDWKADPWHIGQRSKQNAPPNPPKSQKKTVNVERERIFEAFAVGDTFKPTSIRSAF